MQYNRYSRYIIIIRVLIVFSCCFFVYFVIVYFIHSFIDSFVSSAESLEHQIELIKCLNNNMIFFLDMISEDLHKP